MKSTLVFQRVDDHCCQHDACGNDPLPMLQPEFSQAYREIRDHRTFPMTHEKYQGTAGLVLRRDVLTLYPPIQPTPYTPDLSTDPITTLIIDPIPPEPRFLSKRTGCWRATIVSKNACP